MRRPVPAAGISKYTEHLRVNIFRIYAIATIKKDFEIAC
jgi:hypothetical protein